MRDSMAAAESSTKSLRSGNDDDTVHTPIESFPVDSCHRHELSRVIFCGYTLYRVHELDRLE